jgi:ubiquinone/menaquinone biosynthesis C-methylase UbiE
LADELGTFDAQHTYSSAAKTYEDASLRFWQFLSTNTVARLNLRRGHSVLDIACGTGPATLAAAAAVGQSGRVVAVDYAEGMLAIAKQKVEQAGHRNVEFVREDLMALKYGPDPSTSLRTGFDAVVCVLGIFFIQDMVAAASQMWSFVRPGGQLAVTTLGAGVFEPFSSRFAEAVKRQRPDIEIVLPWRRTEDARVLRSTLEQAGVPDVHVTTESSDLPIEPEYWWTVVMGSGFRHTAEQLGPAAEMVRTDNENWARTSGIDKIRVTANYAMATKR